MILLLIVLILVFGFGGHRMGPGLGIRVVCDRAN
jgi:hypothetical protein